MTDKYKNYRERKKLEDATPEEKAKQIKELALEAKLKEWRVWGLQNYRDKQSENN